MCEAIPDILFRDLLAPESKQKAVLASATVVDALVVSISHSWQVLPLHSSLR